MRSTLSVRLGLTPPPQSRNIPDSQADLTASSNRVPDSIRGASYVSKSNEDCFNGESPNELIPTVSALKVHECRRTNERCVRTSLKPEA